MKSQHCYSMMYRISNITRHTKLAVTSCALDSDSHCHAAIVASALSHNTSEQNFLPRVTGEYFPLDLGSSCTFPLLDHYSIISTYCPPNTYGEYVSTSLSHLVPPEVPLQRDFLGLYGISNLVRPSIPSESSPPR
jgi:hypothetical protein